MRIGARMESTTASPWRGEDDAPRVGTAFLRRAKPGSIAEVRTRSARLGGGVFPMRPVAPTRCVQRLGSAVQFVVRAAMADPNRGRIALPPRGGGAEVGGRHDQGDPVGRSAAEPHPERGAGGDPRRAGAGAVPVLGGAGDQHGGQGVRVHPAGGELRPPARLHRHRLLRPHHVLRARRLRRGAGALRLGRDVGGGADRPRRSRSSPASRWPS